MSSSGASADADGAPGRAPASVLHVVCGPTAAGKSAVALRLAARAGGAIVSADSRQLYRGFTIGTAKPAADECRRVPHHGVDVADPRERWSAAGWAAAARTWLAEARAAGRAPLVVGGTGFYLRALVAPLDPVPALDATRRARLLAVLDTWPTDELRRWTEALDPARAYLGRAQLLRAVETALLGGRRLSAAYTAVTDADGTPPLSARYLLVDPGRERLRERIAERVDAMLAAGWLDEVRRLRATVPADAPAWSATGYDVWAAHLDGALSFASARERVIVDTRQYAKRQRTWFRHQLPAAAVTMLDPEAPDADERAARWWAADG